MEIEVMPEHTAALRGLLDVVVNLSAQRDRKLLLETILREARKLARAEAGSLYVVQGGHLRFQVAQNDRISLPDVEQNLLGRDLPISSESLAGFVAYTGRILNIPNTHAMPAGTPFHLDRRFDAATGYRTESVLAIPLNCPDGECVGVLQLINRLGPSGKVVPFAGAESSGVLSLASMAAVSIHNALLQERLKQAHLDSILRLSVAAEFRDDDTGTHVRRISRSCTLLARAMGLSAEQVELIEYAGPMHDIGKIGIPDAILLKPGRLTDAERRILQGHAAIGAKILENSRSELIQMAHDVALTHHEKWDGSGYPRHLAGKQIPLVGRIVGLADVFDALVSRRCYKPAYPLEKALEIIRRDTARHFDPGVADAFFTILDDIAASYSSDPPALPLRGGDL